MIVCMAVLGGCQTQSPPATSVVAGPAVSDARLPPGVTVEAASWCVGYTNTFEGVWTNASGADTLRFRMGVLESDEGCYAPLHPVPEWNIGPDEIGPIAGSVSQSGSSWTWQANGYRVTVDAETMSAEYMPPNGEITDGYLTLAP